MPMLTSYHAWRDVFAWSPVRNFACLLPKPGIRTFPMLVPQHMKEAVIFKAKPSTQTGVLAKLMGKPQLDGGVIARSPHGRIYIMFGRVVTGARNHSNNTAEMSASVEALSFIGPHGPVARDACSCFFYDSKHAAGVCLGTIHARTHVQVGLSCQRLLLKVQLKLRFTMQHVYSHAENLGNECADHAAALGSFGLVSNHNLATCWAHHSFDSIGDVLENYVRACLLLNAGSEVTVSLHAVFRCGLSCLYHCPLVDFRLSTWLNLIGLPS